ncbi:DUF6438 domain-containing protein [Hymenobacter latericus]|uniref:DUF6438 domain-containing protein n=1 Tax=Hymenobacter sp. YIM 151858-1 TaxID=2987688 RepID=UPI002226ACB8|nr:DUF6438 domain-containing protein [Hymenobacter sp. YIM 151858-1]UYZ59336.1 DUF6438 domain-containing protein [Hymenobacter sp. YIM 151858-1]
MPTAPPVESSPQVPTGPTTRLPIEQEPRVEPAPVPQSNAPVLVFSKRPCLGRCPHFEASIFADGRVQYVGYQHVVKMGAHELRLAPEVVAAMLNQANAIQFRSLNEQYLSGASDMPSTFLTLNEPGKPGKTVQVETEAPAQLMSLLNFIESEIGRLTGEAATN